MFFVLSNLQTVIVLETNLLTIVDLKNNRTVKNFTKKATFCEKVDMQKNYREMITRSVVSGCHLLEQMVSFIGTNKQHYTTKYLNII